MSDPEICDICSDPYKLEDGTWNVHPECRTPSTHYAGGSLIVPIKLSFKVDNPKIVVEENNE